MRFKQISQKIEDSNKTKLIFTPKTLPLKIKEFIQKTVIAEINKNQFKKFTNLFINK